jgi:anti-sigma B factor antagonist
MAVPRGDTRPFTVAVTHHGDHDVLAVAGDLDVYTANDVRDVITAAETWGSAVMLLDLSDVAFLDSTGLSAIVSTRRIARSHGSELRLVCPSGSALRVIRMTHLDDVLAIFADRAAALA